MQRSSIILFGIVSAVLLIVSCISLSAPKFYNELEVKSKTPYLGLKPTIVLRDRSVSNLERAN